MKLYRIYRLYSLQCSLYLWVEESNPLEVGPKTIHTGSERRRKGELSCWVVLFLSPRTRLRVIGYSSKPFIDTWKHLERVIWRQISFSTLWTIMTYHIIVSQLSNNCLIALETPRPEKCFCNNCRRNTNYMANKCQMTICRLKNSPRPLKTQKDVMM